MMIVEWRLIKATRMITDRGIGGQENVIGENQNNSISSSEVSNSCFNNPQFLSYITWLPHNAPLGVQR